MTESNLLSVVAPTPMADDDFIPAVGPFEYHRQLRPNYCLSHRRPYGKLCIRPIMQSR